MNSLDPSLKKTIDDIFQVGFKHHQEGRLADAVAKYEQILSLNPHHFDALHLSGLIAAQTGQANMAVDYIKKALEINAADPSAHKNLGIALHNLERYEEAIDSYHQALAIVPNEDRKSVV
jgi:Flp pilus assembly protein TadD